MVAVVTQLLASPLADKLRLFPCQFRTRAGKDIFSPCLGKWAEDDCFITSPDQAQDLWDRFPHAAVATRCDRLIVFDQDLLRGPAGERTAANPWLDSLPADIRSALTTGVWATTPSGARHAYFGLPDDDQGLLSIKQIGWADGVDLLMGRGRVVVLPPSFVAKRVKGYEGRYAWDSGASIPIEFPPLPGPLRDYIVYSGQPTANSTGPAARAPDDLVPIGERHDFLLRRSRYLRGQGLNGIELLGALRSIRDEQCELGAEAISDEELRDIAESAARKFQPDRPQQSGPLKIVSAEDFKKIPPPGFVIKDVLPTGVAVLYADPGVGKSFLCLAIGSAVARREPLFSIPEFAAEVSGPVIFALPEAVSAWAARLRAFDTRYLYETSNQMVFIPEGVNIYDDRGWDLLSEAIERVGDRFGMDPALVIIDTLAAATPGANENAVEDMGKVMNRLQGVSSRGTNVLITHHSSKAGSYRGHSSISGSCDSLLCLRRDSATGVIELVGSKLRHASKVASCPFQIESTIEGPVPVRASSMGVWGRFDTACAAYPGLLDALESLGFMRSGAESGGPQGLPFTTGVPLRSIQAAWNKSVAPDDRAHRNRRTRALRKLVADLVRSRVLVLNAGTLSGSDSEALDAVVVQKELP